MLVHPRPASLLITSHRQEGLPEFPSEWLAMAYYEDDVNKLVDVARSPSGISTLHEATGGDPSSSPRWLANMEYGADQELVAGLRSRNGDVWARSASTGSRGSPCSTATSSRSSGR